MLYTYIYIYARVYIYIYIYIYMFSPYHERDTEGLSRSTVMLEVGAEEGQGVEAFARALKKNKGIDLDRVKGLIRRMWCMNIDTDIDGHRYTRI